MTPPSESKDGVGATSPINGAEDGAASPRQRVVAIFNQDAEQKRKRQPAHYVTWLVDRLAGIVENNDALKAENERMRGALEKILSHAQSDLAGSYEISTILNLSRAALSKKEGN